MNLDMLFSNMLSPPILFFALGIIAALVRSDLELPQPVSQTISYYLLLSIGFLGGYHLSDSPLSFQLMMTLVAAGITSAVIPIWSFFILRLKLDASNAAACAACFGSVSVVTFIAAAGFLEQQGVPFSGVLIAAMAIMECPAIVVGVLLARRYARRPEIQAISATAHPDDIGMPHPGSLHGNTGHATPWKTIIRESVLNGAIVLLLGSLVIGLISGQRGWTMVEPLLKQPFHGVLCLFMLDMGSLAARKLNDLWRAGGFLIAFGLLAPPIHAAMGIAVAAMLGLEPGDALLFTILTASASYIAVPAAMRLTVPEASPSLYVALSLGITFPLNVVLGTPIYFAVINYFWAT